MRVWVTRTQPGADRTAAKLRDLGHEAIVQPVLTFEPLPVEPRTLPPGDVLAFTSAHGVAAYAALDVDRGRTCFVVGDATERAARKAGFHKVFPAHGDVVALAELIASILADGPYTVLWPRAQEPAGDLVGLLKARRVVCQDAAVYRTVEVADPAPRDVDAIMIHSRRGATAVAAKLGGALVSDVEVLAISAAAVEPLCGLPFRRVAIAPRPDESALLGLIDG